MSWKNHLLELRDMYNTDNSVIDRKYFKRNPNHKFDLNQSIPEKEVYIYYVNACRSLKIQPINSPNYEVVNITQSDRLRERRTNTIINTESSVQDVSVKNVIEMVREKLAKKYPDLTFGIDSKYMTQSLEKLLGIANPMTKTSSYVQPDSGFLWVYIGNKKRIILVSEQKRQGTNDRRMDEGKDKQANGNAVERLGKNLDAFDVIFGDEDIYPAVAWIQGCDFYEDESSIPDRIKTMFHFQPSNTINLYWTQIRKHLWSGGSYFMRGHSMFETSGSSDWTINEMFDVMYEIAEKSTEYYIEKYQKCDVIK